MNKRPHVAQYYAEDKDIFDIFMSNRRRFDAKTLVGLARRRGICLSAETDRENLADYLARLVWSWPDLQVLLEMAETPERREKVASTRLRTEASSAEVRGAVESVKVLREVANGEVFTVKNASDNKVVVAVRYSEFDPSRTRLQQRVLREATLEFERGPEGFTVRRPAGERAREIAEAIASQLKENSGKKFEASEIALSGITAPELRTQFFLELMAGIPGFELRNVTSVSVDAAAPHAETEETEGDGDQEDDEENGASSPEAEAMLGIVQKAVFDGESLLTSKEFQNLKSEGFFLSRSVWRSREKKTDGIEVEFEADFEDSTQCTGFRYSVRGIYERRTRGEEGLRKSRSPVPIERRAELLRCLEGSAQVALTTVATKATGQTPPAPDNGGAPASDTSKAGG
jgi:hypothetical protein